MTEPKLADHQIEAELLGIMIMDPMTIPEVFEVTSPVEFALPAHQHVAEAILGLFGDTGTCALPLVAQRLIANKRLEDAGGYVAIARMVSMVTITTTCIELAEVVRDYALRRAAYLATQAILRDLPTLPPTEIAKRLQQASLGLIGGSTSKVSTLEEAIEREIAQIAIDRSTVEQGGALSWRTGLGEFDAGLGGFRPGSLVYIAAATSIGKTAFALELYRRLSGNGVPCSFFSLEMSIGQLVRRRLACDANVSLNSIVSGRLSSGEWGRVQGARTEESGSLLCETFSLDAARLSAMVSSQVSRYGTRVFFVDGIWLMQHARERNGNLAQAYGETSRQLKLLAGRQRVALVVLHQLNRDSARDGGEPKLHHLKESGSLEQDADAVILLHRDRNEQAGKRADGTPAPVTLQVNVAKNRNGSTGKVEMDFYLHSQKIEERRL